MRIVRQCRCVHKENVMAKPKSLKLRTLITLNTLWKYTDSKHRLNSGKLNEHLRPYGLECSPRVLGETVRVLKEFGFDVESKGEWNHYGVWIKNRPLSDDALQRLIFAVTSNPHLTQKQATDILQSLKPCVTVYQEELLKGVVETNPDLLAGDNLYKVYSLVHDAILTKRRVRYTVDYIKYNKENGLLEKKRQWSTLFTPKLVYQTRGRLYMVGYNHPDKRVEAVDLSKVTEIKIAFKHEDKNADEIDEILASVVPESVVSEEKQHIIYKGTVVFRCRGQYVSELYERFGLPSEPIIKNARGKTLYTVKNVTITPETLCWLEQMPGFDIRFAGPELLLKQIKTYYDGVSNAITNAKSL